MCVFRVHTDPPTNIILLAAFSLSTTLISRKDRTRSARSEGASD